MKQMRKIILGVGFVCLFSMLTLHSSGGDTPSPCDDPLSWSDGCCDADGNYIPDDPACPIDGGVVALLAAGVGYGLKRVRDSRKEKRAAE